MLNPNWLNEGLVIPICTQVAKIIIKKIISKALLIKDESIFLKLITFALNSLVE